MAAAIFHTHRHARKVTTLVLRGAIVVVVVALLAIIARSNRAWHQRAIVEHVKSLDARVVYDYGNGAERPSGASWVRQVFGDDFLADVVGVDTIIPETGDETLAAITALPRLRFLVLRNGLDDSAMSFLQSAEQLEQLKFSSPQVTNAGLSHLLQLKRLTHLSISAPRVTDTGLILLESLPGLSYVELIETQVTPQGVNRLREALPNCDVRVLQGTVQQL